MKKLVLLVVVMVLLVSSVYAGECIVTNDTIMFKDGKAFLALLKGSINGMEVTESTTATCLRNGSAIIVLKGTRVELVASNHLGAVVKIGSTKLLVIDPKDIKCD